MRVQMQGGMPSASPYVTILDWYSLILLVQRYLSDQFVRQGFSANRRTINLLAQYIPTVTVIALSFVWQMLVIDMKKVTPWAAMTRKWTDPEDSILANYIDDLEVVSVWKSIRRRHWGMLVALVGGFLCGGLIPFAGGLFYVDPVHEITSNSTLIRTSRFAFNDSIAALVPNTPYVDQPIAALVGERRFRSRLPSWTSSEYAFESFNLSDTPHNKTLSMNSVAFGGILDCGPLNFQSRIVRAWYTENIPLDSDATSPGLSIDVELIPNTEDQAKIGCQIASGSNPQVTFTRSSDLSMDVPPAAWMGTVNCSNTGETPLTITTMILLSEDVNNRTISFNTTGLLCRPRFSTRNVELRVNASTAEIVHITQLSNASIPVDIGVVTFALIGAINRPEILKGMFSFIYSDHVPYKAYAFNFWLYLMETMWGNDPELSGYVRIGVDPWFSILSSNNVTNIRKYADNLEGLATDSSRFFGNIMAQIANFGFKVHDSSPAPGFVHTIESRLTIQRSALLFLQSTLSLLGITAIFCATILRPKSCLREDPTTLIALSTIIAFSEEFQSEVKNQGHLNAKSFRERLAPFKVQLNIDESSKLSIKFQKPAVSLLAELTATAEVLLTHQQTDIIRHKSYERNEGYRPQIMSLSSRVTLLVAVSGMIVTLRTLLKYSISQSGFDTSTQLKTLAWSYIPGTTLVLLGYAIEGVGSCTQALISYISLQNGSVQDQKSMIFNPTRFSVFATFYYSYWRNVNWTLFACSVVMIVYPAIKVTAAGLYAHWLDQHMFQSTITINQSLIANLDRISADNDLQQAIILAATTFATWTLTPQMHFSTPSGTGDSLVFSNLTSDSMSDVVSQALNDGATLSANLPAVQVNVKCSTYTSDDFQTIIEKDVIRVTCKSQGCQRYFSKIESAATIGSYGNKTWWHDGFNISNPDYHYFAELSSFDQAWTDPDDYDLAPISGLFMKIDTHGLNATSQRYNITPQAIAGYSCVRSFNKVNVDVTFTRTLQPNLEGSSLLSVQPSSFDDRSIASANDLPRYITYNVSMNKPDSCVSSVNVTCGSSTSWITPGVSLWDGGSPDSMLGNGYGGMLDIIAATQLRHQADNASSMERLFDP